MKQFTFYKLYSDILDGMNDTDAGKFAMRICEYEFETSSQKRNFQARNAFIGTTSRTCLQRSRRQRVAANR